MTKRPLEEIPEHMKMNSFRDDAGEFFIIRTVTRSYSGQLKRVYTLSCSQFDPLVVGWLQSALLTTVWDPKFEEGLILQSDGRWWRLRANFQSPERVAGHLAEMMASIYLGGNDADEFEVHSQGQMSLPRRFRASVRNVGDAFAVHVNGRVLAEYQNFPAADEAADLAGTVDATTLLEAERVMIERIQAGRLATDSVAKV